MNFMVENLLGTQATDKVTLAEAFKILLDMDLINIGEAGEQTISKIGAWVRPGAKYACNLSLSG